MQVKITPRILDRIYDYHGQKVKKGYVYVCKADPARSMILPLDRPRSVVSKEGSMELASKNQMRQFQKVYKLETTLKALIGDQAYQQVYHTIGSRPYILGELVMGLKQGQRPSIQGYGLHLAQVLSRVLDRYRTHRESLDRDKELRFQYLSRNKHGVEPLRRMVKYNLIQEHDHYRVCVSGDQKIQALQVLNHETRNMGIYKLLT